MKLILLGIVIVFAVIMTPKATKQNNMNINRVQTDAKVTYPHTERLAGAWFCEAVLPTKS